MLDIAPFLEWLRSCDGEPSMLAKSLHLHPLILAAGYALLLAACNDDAAEANSLDECELPRSASAEPDSLAYNHPYARLAERPGPVPLFEALDDEHGQRYLIRSGGSINEDGVFRRAPVL